MNKNTPIDTVRTSFLREWLISEIRLMPSEELERWFEKLNVEIVRSLLEKK